MAVSVRPALTAGIAGVIALSPVLAVAPSAELAAHTGVETPLVYAGDIQLTGLGQDIYNAIQPWVQYGVELAAFGVGFIPVIGPPIASQININYFFGVQPFVSATVNYAASVVQNPLNFGPSTIAYGNALFGNTVSYINQQLAFIGFPPLPPFPFAATAAAPARAAAAGPADIPASVLRAPAQRVTVVRDAVRSVIEARTQARNEVREAALSARTEIRDAVRDAVEDVQKAAGSGSPTEVRQAVREGTTEIRSAVKEANAEVRAAAKGARGEVRTAVKEARASVRAAHGGAKDAAK